MHNMRFGVGITVMACIITFLTVESILHKDEKGCQNWILEIIESASNGRLQDESETSSGKERSFNIAMKVLREHNDIRVVDKIKACNDIDALRIIAFTATITAWPMEASPNFDFDNKMDGIFFIAMKRLFEIDSDEADESIECYKRAFPPDGAYSLFLKECEEERKKLRSRRNSNTNEQGPVKMSPERH